jgi:hypothetical protein
MQRRKQPPKQRSNRTFIILAGVMIVLFVLGLITIVVLASTR